MAETSRERTTSDTRAARPKYVRVLMCYDGGNTRLFRSRRHSESSRLPDKPVTTLYRDLPSFGRENKHTKYVPLSRTVLGAVSSDVYIRSRFVPETSYDDIFQYPYTSTVIIFIYDLRRTTVHIRHTEPAPGLTTLQDRMTTGAFFVQRSITLGKTFCSRTEIWKNCMCSNHRYFNSKLLQRIT